VNWATVACKTAKLVISRRSSGRGHSKSSMYLKSETCEASHRSFGMFNVPKSEAKLEGCSTLANTTPKGLNILPQHEIQKVEDLL
jgi:hypothetical protein